MTRSNPFLHTIHLLLPLCCVNIFLGATHLLTVDGFIPVKKCISCSSRSDEVFTMLRSCKNRIYWRPPVRQSNYDTALRIVGPIDAEIEPTGKDIQIRDRSTIFATSNVYVEQIPVPHGVWGLLVPPLQLLSSNKNKDRHSNGVDVAVTFSNAETGARDLLECVHFSSRTDEKKKQQAFHHLVQLLTIFQEIFEQRRTYQTKTPPLSLDSSNRTNAIQYKARLVASRGVSGSKCSRFHVDHVPIRLICALEGPGVVYIDDCYRGTTKEVKIDRNHWRKEGLVNASDEMDTEMFNSKILQLLHEESIPVRHAKTGDAVIMMGKKWEKQYAERNKSNDVGAVVHRSPNLSHFQGRVLLTVDVIESP